MDGVKKVKKTLKKNKPASFTLKGLCAGYSIIAVHVKLNKKIKGVKEFDLRFHAYTADKPTPTQAPTRTPKATPTATPTATPEDPYNYTVTYTHNLSADKVVTGMPDPLVVKVPKDGDGKLTLPPAPQCEGYYLDSWIYKNDYRYSPGTVVTVDKDMTIKARFVRDTDLCIIQYETGVQEHPEITGVINGKAVPRGGTLTISTIKPSWAGHEFSGWQIKGYSEIYQPGQQISNIHSDFTLYAVWDVDVSNLPAPTLPADEATVLAKILAKKTDYPEGSPFSAGIEYLWKYANIFINCHGSAAFTAILSDEGFGLDYEYFTIAEANDEVVHWNTKLPRSTSIGHIDCRW